MGCKLFIIAKQKVNYIRVDTKICNSYFTFHKSYQLNTIV